MRRSGYCGYSSFLEGSDHQGEGLLRAVPQHQVPPGVDVDPDVHLTVLLLVVDPSRQGCEGEVKAGHTVLTSWHWQLHISAIFLTEKGQLFCIFRYLKRYSEVYVSHIFVSSIT